MSITPIYSIPAAAASLALVLLSACKDPTKPMELPVTLEAVSVAVTDVRLKVSMNDSGTVRHYRLARDGELRNEGSFVGSDTTLADRELAPNTSYTYRAFSLHEGQVVDSSDIVQVITMDTTSTNFYWTIDTIKGYFNYFKDVAIVGPDDIWAVGNILKDDDVDQFFNAVHWDGSSWDTLLIKYETQQQNGEIKLSFQTLEAIYAFRSGEIWLGGTRPVFYDGESWSSFGPHNSSWSGGGYLKDIWGNSPDDVYFVGGNGLIYHWDGTDFERMDSGTEITLRSVSGEGEHVFVLGYNAAEDVILERQEGTWHTILSSNLNTGDPQNGDYGRAYALAVLGDTVYITLSEGLLKYSYLTGLWSFVSKNIMGAQNLAMVHIFAPQLNDIQMFDVVGKHLLFNGLYWRWDTKIPDERATSYHGADYKNGIAAMAGSSLIGGLIYIGRRIE